MDFYKQLKWLAKDIRVQATEKKETPSIELEALQEVPDADQPQQPKTAMESSIQNLEEWLKYAQALQAYYAVHPEKQDEHSEYWRKWADGAAKTYANILAQVRELHPKQDAQPQQ